MTILKKEFYFIRHGQTDQNVAGIYVKLDHDDIPLNAVGQQQAHAVEPFIATLPVKAVCHSPLRRAKETKDIVASRLKTPQYEINTLGECSAEIWLDMVALGKSAHVNPPSHVKKFIDNVLDGINSAISKEGPVLIVAHGGIHWALCCVLGIENHDWGIDNCVPVHFSVGEDGRWNANKLV